MVTKEVMDKILRNERFLYLLLNGTPLSQKMWGLDEETKSQFQQVKEAYEADNHLIDSYHSELRMKEVHEMIENVHIIEQLCGSKVVVSSDFLGKDISFDEFVELFTVNHSCPDINGMTINIYVHKDHRQIIKDSKVEVENLGNNNYVKLGTHAHLQGILKEDIKYKFLQFVGNDVVRFKSEIFMEYFAEPIPHHMETYDFIAEMIRNFKASLYWYLPENSDIKLQGLREAVDVIEDPISKRYLNFQLKVCQKILDDMKELYDPNVSLLEKLMKNNYGSKVNFWVVPGASGKKCIFLIHKIKSDLNEYQMACYLSKNGFGGSIIISDVRFDNLSVYLIKTRTLSAFIHDNAGGYSIKSHQALDSDDIDFVESLPNNLYGEPYNASQVKSFLDKIKPADILK